jgi:hypothetical protein
VSCLHHLRLTAPPRNPMASSVEALPLPSSHENTPLDYSHRNVMLHDSGRIPMEQFTLDEAKRWIGRTVIAKTAWNAGSAQMAAEQQGTVIGVQGEHTLQGAPVLCLVVQLWPEKHGDVPNVIFVPKPTFNAYLCLSHTVEGAPPYEGDPAAGA